MTLDLIKIRRDLHQIPEIGLEEFKTQAYLLERIAEMTEGKDFVEQRTWRTGILVYLHGYAPEKPLVGVQTLTLFRLKRKQVFPSNLLMRVVCMPVVTIFI
ncbi:N-acetyl-L,L-diaminopimelate deacetylase [Streptococcus sp. HSISS2]|nr:N-acetyl-L,L-diaminopimelate deacetylase [Streptococcus sp. HSISS2]